MRIIVFAAMLAFAAVPAFAEDKPAEEIDLQYCSQLVAHQPDADVAYQPGEDVNGNPVVEADLNPSPVKVPDKVSFDVTVDIAQYLGLTAPAGLEGQAKMGTIAYENSVLTFNGEPMDGPAVAALREMCGEKKQENDKEKARKISIIND